MSDSQQPYDVGLTTEASLTRLSRLGLVLEKRLDARWELAAQLLAKDQQISADWAFLSYYPVTNLTLRLGRQKMPIWLISDHIDVGHTYPWVSPPGEVYRLNPINSLNGLGATYRLPLGAYAVVLDGFISGSAPQEYNLTSLNSDEHTNSATVRNYASANLTLESDSFTLRFAYAKARTSVSTDQFKIDKLFASFYTAGIKANYKGALFLAEYAANSGHIAGDEVAKADAGLAAAQAAAAAPGAAQNPQVLGALQQAYIQDGAEHAKFVGGRGWYTTAAYQLGDVQPIVTFARLRSPKDSAAAGDQDSVSGGVRYDVNLSADLKLQAQHIWPRHDTHGLLDDQSNGAPTSYHQLNVYSAAVNVTF